MKRLSLLTTFTLLFLFVCQGLDAQVKKFDYSLLEGKILYLPTYEVSEKFKAKMSKKGKYEKLANKQEKVDQYNAAWKQAMAESSYEVTDYEIRAFDQKKMIKEKNRKAILLTFQQDDAGNASALMVVTHPKRLYIATAFINGLDLTDKNDIRLMMNLLDDNLSTNASLDEEGEKGFFGTRKKYKENVVKFYDSIKEMTFLIPEATHKKQAKADKRNADLKEALKTWSLCKYEFTTQEAIEEKRLEGDPSSFYWRDFPIYTENPLITYHYNFILSTEGDVLLVGFLGKKRLKPATLEQIQKKIVAKGEKFKKQLAKKK